MSSVPRARTALGVALVLAACGGGSSGGTSPPGPPTQLVKSPGTDGQNWYFNNPLPTPLKVTAEDASNHPVPGVVIMWAVASGGGGLTRTQDTTDANGQASTIDSLGSSTIQNVNASFSSYPASVSFTEVGVTPPTSGAVSVMNNFFNPDSLVVQAGGTVTWTWNSGGTAHTLTFTSGPPPLPTDTTQSSGTRALTFNTVGTYLYHCTIHAGMSGALVVVH